MCVAQRRQQSRGGGRDREGQRGRRHLLLSEAATDNSLKGRKEGGTVRERSMESGGTVCMQACNHRHTLDSTSMSSTGSSSAATAGGLANTEQPFSSRQQTELWLCKEQLRATERGTEGDANSGICEEGGRACHMHHACVHRDREETGCSSCRHWTSLQESKPSLSISLICPSCCHPRCLCCLLTSLCCLRSQSRSLLLHCCCCYCCHWSY